MVLMYSNGIVASLLNERLRLRVIVRDSLLPDLACIRDENLSMLYGDCNALNLAYSCG